jgi:CBS domain containing-hemolysin-like protein
LDLYDLDTRYGVVVPLDAAYSTIGGFMLTRLGARRHVGDSVDANGFRFTVLKIDREFISQVKMENLSSVRT